MKVVPLEAPRMREAVDYLTAPHTPLPERRASVGEIGLDSGLIFVGVFGRDSKHLRRAAREASEVADIAHVSGYVGKDSGELPGKGATEADSVGDEIEDTGTRLIIDRDPSTRTGLDNAAHTAEAMATIREEVEKARSDGIILPSIEQVFAVTHPPQLRRLRGFLRYAMNPTRI